MKVLQLLLIATLSLLISKSYGQDITEGSRSFMKKESANAISIVVQGQVKNVEAVMEKKMQAATGQKSRSTKGLKMYESARLAGRSETSMDMYYRVERASKSDKHHSRVNLFLSSGNNNFIDSETNPSEVAAAKEILSGLQLDVEIYELELAIEEQNKVIDKASKDHSKMVNDSMKLEVKLAETQQAIETNKIDRKNQLELIDQEKIKLSEFQDYLHQLRTNGYKSDDVQDMEVMDEEIKNVEEITDEMKEEKTDEKKGEKKGDKKEGGDNGDGGK